jgi:hypothetical protein
VTALSRGAMLDPGPTADDRETPETSPETSR